ncbi:hypothetical protein BD770DRAFT_477723 [Pilaira anomala]|nr:hypothetical protein BD770DRAFT_477723 [Pilaira anomala]
MGAIQWVYSSGQKWVSLDTQAQSQIEKLWNNDQANWVTSDSFSGPVFVDTTQMLLVYEGYSNVQRFTIETAATVSVRSTEVDEATLETGSNIRAERATRPAEVVPAAYISELDKMEPLDLGRMDIQCPDCKVYHWKGKKTNGGSSWESCCKKGSVKLPLLNELSQLLNDLLTGAHPKSTVFLKNVRQYTSAFAFTSFGTAVKSSINNTGSRFMLFQAHGKLYHLQGPISSSGNSRPQYSQLYIYDPASFAADIRFTDQRNHLLDRDLKKDLSIMLHYQCNNPFVEIYKHAHKILSTEADRQLRENNNEFFYVGLNPQMKMELIVAYMPLHYVLLFPAGDYGWNWGMRLANSDKDLRKESFIIFDCTLKKMSLKTYSFLDA